MLFGLVILVYSPVFRCGFIWDDDDYIVENRSIQTWEGLPRIWLDPKATPQYYPLVHTTFWVEHQLWGLNPTGYHIVNVLLHAASTVVLWRVLATLQVPGAWIAAAVFGVHPVHVESVAWVTERKNVLSGLCYLSALNSILPLLSHETPPVTWRNCLGRYLIATLFFVGALLSKSVTCSLPAAYLLIAYWKNGRVTKRDTALMMPWFVLGFSAAMQTAWLERTHVGASGSIFSWTFLERCWIAGNALWFYLGKLIWPKPLIFFYPRWAIDTHNATGWVAPICAVLLPIGLWLARGRIGRGPLVASLFFGGTLLPALGFVNLYPMRYSFVADHFQYLASLGPIVLFVGGGMSIISRSSRHRWWASLASGLLLLPLCLTTYHQQAIYRDVESLWSDVLIHNPTSFAAHFHLGKVRTAQGRHADASEHFRESLRLQSDDSDSHITLTLLGNSLARQGEFNEAEACLNEALRRHPADWEAMHGLATIAGRQSRHAEAIDLFRQVLSIRPNDPVVRTNLGNALSIVGDLNSAITEYESALVLRPEYVDANFNLANVLARQKRFREAEQLYVKVLKQQPQHVQANSNLARVRAAIKNESPTSR